MGSVKREDCIEVRFVEASEIGYEQFQVGQNVTTSVSVLLNVFFFQPCVASHAVQPVTQ